MTRAAERASTLKVPPTVMSDNNQKPAPTLDPYTVAYLGRQLRAMYADIVAEGVPERFAEILRKLDEPGDERQTR